jgi:hypothetical protein
VRKAWKQRFTFDDAKPRRVELILLMDVNFEAVVYLKDSTFIPDYADINVNVGPVIFQNSDSILHTIQCRGIRDMSELVIPPGKYAEISFPSPGRFEFSSTVYGLMKVIYFNIPI